MGVGGKSATPFATIMGGCATAAGTDYVCPFNGTATAATKVSGSNVANQFAVAAQAMTITAIYVVAPSAFALAAGQAVTLVKNGVDTALTATTAALNTPVSGSGSVSLAAGDKWSLKVVEPSATGFVIWGLACQ